MYTVATGILHNTEKYHMLFENFSHIWDRIQEYETGQYALKRKNKGPCTIISSSIAAA